MWLVITSGCVLLKVWWGVLIDCAKSFFFFSFFFFRLHISTNSTKTIQQNKNLTNVCFERQTKKKEEENLLWPCCCRQRQRRRCCCCFLLVLVVYCVSTTMHSTITIKYRRCKISLSILCLCLSSINERAKEKMNEKK